MKKTKLAGLLGLFAVLPTYAQDSIHTDNVVVTASRIPQSRESVLADVTVITQDEIERAGQSTLVELLQMQPGVEVSSSGGAGKESSIFLRGTNDDHVVVLVDGLRINSATKGKTAFESIPLSQIGRIEILRGPASSLYGADAIGGVIQIFTKRGEGGMKFNAFAGFGSNDVQRAEAGFSGSANGTSFTLQFGHEHDGGLSATNVSNGADDDRDPYRNESLNASLSHRFNEDHEIALQLFAADGHSNYDSTATTRSRQYQTAYADNLLLSYGLTSRNRLLPWWNSTLRLGSGKDRSQNFTRTVAGKEATSEFETDQFQATWQNDLSLPVGTLTLAYDRLQQRVDSTTSYTINSRDNNGWLASYLADVDAHSMQISLRRDDNSQYGQHTTGGLAYGYRITPQWQASASFGTAFKAPTFNQLYYPGFGNAQLQPEKSRNREAALRYRTGHASAGVTVFDNEIEELIVYAPTPVNLNRANLLGATVDGAWYFGRWKASGNFTVQSPRDDASNHLLPRRGQRHGVLNLAYQAHEWRVGAELFGVSERYNNSTNTKRMDGYALVNLTAEYQFAGDWQLEARANNIFDKDYVLAYVGNTATSAAFETPGASLFVGLRWQPQ